MCIEVLIMSCHGHYFVLLRSILFPSEPDHGPLQGRHHLVFGLHRRRSQAKLTATPGYLPGWFNQCRSNIDESNATLTAEVALHSAVAITSAYCPAPGPPYYALHRIATFFEQSDTA